MSSKGNEAILMEEIDDIVSTGALYAKYTKRPESAAGYTGGTGADLGFDASLANALYGASETIMVDSYNQYVAIYLS